MNEPKYTTLDTPYASDRAHWGEQVVSDEPVKPNGIWVAGHWFVGLCLLLATWTPFMYFLPLYPIEISTPISVWWGVDPKVKGSGRPEMVLPTVFFLGMVLPVVVGALLFTWIRSKSPLVVPPFSHLFHRKPKILRYLVSYGELLFLAIIVVGNILVCIYMCRKRKKPGKDSANDILDVIGYATGLNSLYNMAFLALPSSRHCFWMEWLNIPFARGVKYHRWLAVVSILFAIVHMLVYSAAYIRQNKFSDLWPCFDCDLAKNGLRIWMNFFGVLAFALLMIIGITSLPVVRRKYYSLFYAAHFLFIPMILFFIVHYPSVVYWMYTTMVLYMVNRMYSSASIRTPVTVERAVAMPSQVVELTLQCATGFSPGDAVWLKVPAISATQWHPFSVASSPLHTPGLITLYIKSIGNWTESLYHYVSQCQQRGVDPIVYMDGGYTPAAPIPADHSSVVFVGGGIGVTPLMGKMIHILRTRPQQSVWLIWHVRRSEMLMQFQAWLRDVEALAASTGGRLQLRLHVTQESSSTVDVSDRTERVFHEPSDTPAPRPYARLDTTKRMLLLFLAFAFSGVLLVLLRYRNKIVTARADLWILQRVAEFCVIVVGSYLAYGITYIQPYVASTVAKRSNEATDKKMMDSSDFASHYNVQFQRANWTQVFQDVEGSIPKDGTVGVYVSGPKPLMRSIDEHLQEKPMYHVHQEEFEL